jgi:hypothetical protein
MNIMKLFSREATVEQATAEQPTEGELQRQLAEVEIAIAAGEGDVVALLEEKESLKLQVQAARIRSEKLADAAYRANHKKVSDEYRKRLSRCVEAIGDLAPRFLWELQELAALELESYGVPDPGFGERIPYGFAAKVRAAILEASEEIEWHYDFVGDPSKRNGLPRKKAAPHYTIHAVQTDIYGNALHPNMIDPGSGLLILPNG